MENVQDIYPLTPTQEGMLYHTLQSDDPATYFSQVRCDLSGALDVERLRRAWQAVVERHPALRTAFVWRGVKHPVQVVRQTVEVPWAVVDHRAAPLSAEELDDLAAAHRADPFDLQRAPICRFTLIRQNDDLAHLIWDFHHILLDGWSATMVFDEAMLRYRDPDRAPFEPGPPIRPYVEWLARQDPSAAETYWRSLLDGFELDQELLIGRPSGVPFRLGRYDTQLPEPLSRELESFARREGLTFNTVVQGAWALTLERLTDRDDIIFGVVSSGRPPDIDGIESAVGMFLTTLPLRVSVAGPTPAREWLAGIQDQQLDLLTHQHTPLASIRQWAGVPPGAELFETVLVFENYPIGDGDPRPEDQIRLSAENKIVFDQTHYDLTVMVIPGHPLRISVLYNRNRFTEREVGRAVALFRTQFESLIRRPGARPLEVSALDPEDRRALDQWNDTTVPGQDEATLPQILAAADPGDVAFIDAASGARLSHRELSERADDVETILRRRGVGRGDVVALALDRSFDLVTASAAVWRLGAATLALGADLPSDRMNLLLGLARAEVVVDAALLTGESGAIAAGQDDRPAREEPRPDDVAALVFTSGSTGRPKPVELTHRGLVNRFAWQSRTFPPGEDEVGVAKTPLAFVDHLWELWGPVCHGSPVVLLSGEVGDDPLSLLDVIDRYPVRHLTLVPSLLDALLDLSAERRSALSRVRRMTVSGEPLTTTLAQRVRRELPTVTLLDYYGMSEATADVTWYDVSSSDPATWGEIGPPIGRPIDNIVVDVRDRHGRLVPLGVVGELWVGGSGLARGYRHQPEATAERFVEATDPSGRRYRTGDRGRWRPDGVLEYVGRSDRQLKIRGARVEPAEVEAALVSLPEVAEAVVGSTGPPLRQRLVARVRLVPDAVFDPDRLRAQLARRLPANSVPTEVFQVDSLAHLPSGKIDRTVFAPPDGDTPESARPRADRPPTEAEAAMIRLWTEVLEPDRPLGPDDDFFEVGGDSLLALRLFSRVDKAYGRDLPLAEVFEAPTPAAMVRRLTTTSLEPGSRPLFLLTTADGRALTRRLADTAAVVALDPADTVPNLVSHIVESQVAGSLLIAAQGNPADTVLALCHALHSAGRPVEALFLIAAGSELSAPAPGAGPARLVFFEPVDPEDLVSALVDGELRDRLADRPDFDGWASSVETVLVPGDADSVLTDPNVSWLANLLAERIGGKRWRYLVPISAGEPEHGPARTLFGVHGEYGNVVGYRDLAAALGTDWSVVGVQASGVHGVQPLHQSIEEMAEAYLEEILTYQPEGPYLIGGYSAGGTIALEMVRRLVAAGHEVEALVWFDHFRRGATRPETRLERFLREAKGRVGAIWRDRSALTQGLARRRLRRLSSQIDLSADDTWWWEISRMTADRAEAENLRGQLIHDNIRAARTRHRHGPYDGTIVLYQAEILEAYRLPDRGWSDEEYNLVRVTVPGDHLSLLLAGNVEAIAADLRRRFPTESTAEAGVQTSSSPSI